MGADVLRRVKTFFFFIGERPDLLGNLRLQGRKTVRNDTKASCCEVCMLWFSFIRDINFIFLRFKLIIIHYHTQNPHEIKLNQKIKIEPQNVHFNGCLCALLPFYRTYDKLPYTSFQYIIGFKEVVVSLGACDRYVTIRRCSFDSQNAECRTQNAK